MYNYIFLPFSGGSKPSHLHQEKINNTYINATNKELTAPWENLLFIILAHRECSTLFLKIMYFFKLINLFFAQYFLIQQTNITLIFLDKRTQPKGNYMYPVSFKSLEVSCVSEAETLNLGLWSFKSWSLPWASPFSFLSASCSMRQDQFSRRYRATWRIRQQTGHGFIIMGTKWWFSSSS